jgi:hypothetical protein
MRYHFPGKFKNSGLGSLMLFGFSILGEFGLGLGESSKDGRAGVNALGLDG